MGAVLGDDGWRGGIYAWRAMHSGRSEEKIFARGGMQKKGRADEVTDALRWAGMGNCAPVSQRAGGAQGIAASMGRNSRRSGAVRRVWNGGMKLAEGRR